MKINGFASRIFLIQKSLMWSVPRPKPPQKWWFKYLFPIGPQILIPKLGVNLHSKSGLNLTRKIGVGVICKSRRGYLGKVSGEIEGDSWGGFLVTTLKVVVGCESRGRDEYELSALWC